MVSMSYSPEAAANLSTVIAESGQMIPQDMQAVHLVSSKHTAKGSPWRLNSSFDMARIFSGHALTQRVQPLHLSRFISGRPLDTGILLNQNDASDYHVRHFLATKRMQLRLAFTGQRDPQSVGAHRRTTLATFQELSEAIQKGNAPKAKELTSALLADNNGAGDILNKGLLDGMDKVGQRFKCNEIYIPEVLIAARAMNASMDILKPELVKAGVKPVGKMLIGTVKGDLHDIGKNLVKMMAQGAGIDVVDLGIDVSADKFVQGLKDNPDAKAVGISALLTTTMTGMKDVVDRFEKEGLRNKVKVMVGGAPLTDQYAKEIGADGYAPDAASASEKLKAFLRA
jgi:5-methyltetrahydrofolate--homocysteine methyltransferase